MDNVLQTYLHVQDTVAAFCRLHPRLILAIAVLWSLWAVPAYLHLRRRGHSRPGAFFMALLLWYWYILPWRIGPDPEKAEQDRQRDLERRRARPAGQLTDDF